MSSFFQPKNRKHRRTKMAKRQKLQVVHKTCDRNPTNNNSLKLRIDDMATFSAMTETQGQFFSLYNSNKAFLLHGCAGTGKTFIALYRALEEVLMKGNSYDKVVIVRSAVPSRDIGHLPGDEKEKTEVYSLPYQSMCQDFFPKKPTP